MLMSCGCASAAKGKCTQLHILKAPGWEEKKETRYFSVHLLAAFFYNEVRDSVMSTLLESKF